MNIESTKSYLDLTYSTECLKTLKDIRSTDQFEWCEKYDIGKKSGQRCIIADSLPSNLTDSEKDWY